MVAVTMVAVTSLVLGCATVAVLARGAGQTATMSASVWSGVYSSSQAAAGETLYFERCASCHGDDLGGRERAPALAGPQFLDAWHGKSLWRMLERIEEMPPGMPVSSMEGVNLLAFLLSSSEIPSGPTTLPADRARLAEITFERTKP
jgi:mono/diheme cytochrome c family protein